MAAGKSSISVRLRLFTCCCCVLFIIVHSITTVTTVAAAAASASASALAAIGSLQTELLHVDNPKFGEPISNVTIPVGREAIIECVVEDLGTFKIAWLRVDTQTILTIHNHVITKNHRIGVTHSDHRTWHLHIRDVRESDRGWYMCQINTDPMKSQVGFLQVVVPPDILDYPTSTDMVIREGLNVTLRCAANGSPEPSITWRREAGEPIPLGNGIEVPSVDGAMFNITKVNRLHMGAYLCIASNGVPPSVSKRIMLIVHFPPMIWIQNQLVGAYEGQQMTLDCHSEAYPKSINYWTRDKGDIIVQGAKYEPSILNNAYKVHMKLTIKSVGPSDFGTYKCVSKNSLGDTDGSIKLYQIPYPSTPKPVITTVQSASSQNPDKGKDKKLRDRQKEQRPAPKPDIINEILNQDQSKDRDFHVRNKPTPSGEGNNSGGSGSGSGGSRRGDGKPGDDYLSSFANPSFSTLWLLPSLFILNLVVSSSVHL